MVIVASSLLFSAAGIAAGDADRDKLNGAWESRGDAAARTSWTLWSNGDALQITQVENDRTLVDFECNTVGRECDVKESGKPMKVSMWFNGPRLVVMETRGKDVVKRRFHTTGDANEIEMEVIRIVPQGKPELLRLY